MDGLFSVKAALISHDTKGKRSITSVVIDSVVIRDGEMELWQWLVRQLFLK